MDTIIGAALIGGLCGVAGALIAGAFGRSKNKAETNQIVTDTVLKLIDPLNKRITSLEIELQDWKDCADARAKQLQKQHIVPSPFKSSKKPDALVT